MRWRLLLNCVPKDLPKTEKAKEQKDKKKINRKKIKIK